PDSDHFSICKPNGKTAQVHQYLLYFLEDNQLVSSKPEALVTTPNPEDSARVTDQAAKDSASPAPTEPSKPVAPDSLVLQILDKMSDPDKIDKYGRDKAAADRWADADKVYEKFVKLTRDGNK